jgi:hypothetical protein
VYPPGITEYVPANPHSCQVYCQWPM